MRYQLAAWLLALGLAFSLAGCQPHPERVARESSQPAAASPEELKEQSEAVPKDSLDNSVDDLTSVAPADDTAAAPAEDQPESAPESTGEGQGPAPSEPALATAAVPAGERAKEVDARYLPLNTTSGGRRDAERLGKLQASLRSETRGRAAAGKSFFRNNAVGGIAPAGPALGDVEGEIDGLAEAFALEVKGEGVGGDRFAMIDENDFELVKAEPLSTFSIDVDTASYSRVRSYLMQYGQLPPPDAVRIEELVNYFPYDYAGPMDREHPFVAHMEVAECPWAPEHRLARIAIKGQEVKQEERPASNLVFLIDTSGSMNQADRLPLVIEGLTMLTGQLNKNDKVAIVVYAGAAGLVLPATTGDEQKKIIDSLEALHAGGSTNGGEGLMLAYKTAEENFITAGTNRVILCSDGDFNVGVTHTGGIVGLAEEYAKKNIYLSVLSYGTGNLNDEMLEQLANKAGGNHAYIDGEREAKKVLVEQMEGTLVTIAKDVKIQVEFNPAKVAAYRLIGYENRMLAAEDFNNDKKDAGEIGAGHTVTALYEIVPASVEDFETPKIDDLKYQNVRELTDAAKSDELLTLKLRYKHPEGDVSTLMAEPVKDDTQKFSASSKDFKFAAAVASFGMLLRGSQYKGDTSYDAVLEIATDGASDDKTGYRAEFLEIVKKAKELTGERGASAP